MAYTQLQIYNNALRYLGEGKLANLSEDRGPRYLLDDVWDEDPIKFALEQGTWGFAVKTLKLTADPGLEPDFGYRYGFEKPEDYIGTAAISDNEYFQEPYNAFADEAGYWYADIDIMYVKIVSDANDYGRNTARWTASFFEYVSAYCAWKVVGRITTNKTSRDELQAIMDKNLSNAQGKDAKNRPTSFPSRGSWNSARMGRNYNREGRR